MRCLLIFPPSTSEYFRDYNNVIGMGMPLGIASLAAALEQAGAEVDIFDFQLPGNDLKRLAGMLAGGYDFAGLSFFTPSARAAKRIIEEVRAVAPSTPVVVGGPHVTGMGAAALEECDADIAAFGEGERTIVQLLNAVPGGDFSGVRGIAYRDGGRVVETAPQPVIADLDTLPFAALHLFDIKKYTPPGGVSRYFPSLHTITSRGCPFDCVFCFKKSWGRGVRFRSVGNILREIARMTDELGAREIMFFDDTFTVNRERAVSLCEALIAENRRLPWKCSSRVDCVDGELVRLMKRAGCYSIGFGMESGNAEVLKRSGKGITLEQVRRAVEETRRAGMEIRGYFIFNLPGDTRETMRETARFAFSLDLTFANFTIAEPFVGTKLREMVENDPRCRVVEDKWNNWDAYADKDVIYTQGDVTADELKRINSRAYLGFYLRPAYILKSLARINSLTQIRAYAYAAYWVIKRNLLGSR